MKRPLFTGSGVALVTPMYADGSVNYDKLSELIEIQIRAGTSAIIVCGTTGEASTLEDQEKLNIFRFTIAQVNDRIPVIAGTGSNNTRHSAELSKETAKLGADGILVVTPYYNKCSQNGLIAHYEAIAEAAGIPVIAYNVPSRTGVSMTAETCQILSHHPMINGIKEASGNLDLLLKIRALCGDNLTVWSGNDSQIVPYMSMGAAGVISVLANICPEDTTQITELCLGGDFISAEKIQTEYGQLISALFSDVNPIPVKTAMNLMGMNVGPLRLPLSPMADSQITRMQEVLKNYSLL